MSTHELDTDQTDPPQRDIDLQRVLEAQADIERVRQAIALLGLIEMQAPLGGHVDSAVTLLEAERKLRQAVLYDAIAEYHAVIAR